MAQLAAERLTGKSSDGFTNSAMEWGTETEPQARAEYTMRTGVMIDEVGFIPHTSIANSGASPDGKAGDDGLVEIKCPNTSTHIATLRGGQIKSGYTYQMQWQMACTGRNWCDFVSFDPRMPDHLSMHIKRVPRDNAEISRITEGVSSFERELSDLVAELEAY
jgi:putative phage-type endonuclease